MAAGAGASTARAGCVIDGGIVDAPGLYVLGLNFMRRRKSSFIHGAEDDVRELGEHLLAKLKKSPARARLSAQEIRAGI